MSVLNIALLAAFLPAVLASPQHGSMFHGPHRASKNSAGWPYPTGGPFQSSSVPVSSSVSGSAPFPAGNSTAGGATATGAGMVTIKSTINLIPVPLTSTVTEAGQSTATTAASGLGGSGQSGSLGSPSGVAGGYGQAAAVCGPATVTVTTANTVTVTVQASPSASPIESAKSSAPVQSSVVPYPVYNSSISTGPTGTGRILTSYVATTSTLSPVASSSATPKIVQEASDGQVFVPATPVEAGVASTPSPSVAGVVSTSSPAVAVKADYHKPAAPAEAPAKAPALPAPVSSPPVSSAVPIPVYSPVSTAPSAPTTSPSTGGGGSGGSGGGTGVKARGLLYSYNNQQLSPAESLAQANDVINEAVGWMANWDSSPCPGSGKASGSPKVEFVAQLWGTDETHVAAWQTNANTPWLLSLNEPDNCGGGGSCHSWKEAGDAHTAHIAPLRSGHKVTTPCTQNNVGSPGIGSDYMASFLAQFPPNSFDAICFHWYGPGTQTGLNGSNNPQSLAATVAAYQKLQKQYDIAELWISEGGPEDAAPDMVNAFLEWLDDSSNGVDRYLWNGLNSPTSVVQVGAGSAYLSR